jgi:uncharacterized protein (TIGR02646 family)
MKFIKKGQEPESLQRYRREPYASYEGYPEKDELREVLAREQGFLCCYCMSRISADADGMKIEHWAAQSRDKAAELHHANMLASCKGGDGMPQRIQHCDTHKADKELTVSPTDPACERKVTYNPTTGEIRSDDPVLHRDLDETLNLNLPWLKRNRKDALDNAIQRMERKREGEWSRSLLEKESERWSRKDGESKYPEYCRIVLYWIERRFQRAKP